MLPQASPGLTANILNIIKDRQIVGLLGFLGLIWTAMNLFGSIRTVLNKTLEIISHHGYLREKLHDLLYVLVTGILFLLSIVLSGIFDLIRTIPVKLGLPPLFGSEVVGLDGRHPGGLLFFGVDVFYPVPFFAHAEDPPPGPPFFRPCSSPACGRWPSTSSEFM